MVYQNPVNSKSRGCFIFSDQKGIAILSSGNSQSPKHQPLVIEMEQLSTMQEGETEIRYGHDCPIAHLPPCIKLRGTTTTMQNKRIMSNGCHMWFMYIHVHSNQPARRTANCKGFAGAADWLFGLCSLGKHKLRTRRAKYKYLIQGKHGPVIENCAVYFRPGSLLLRWDEGFWALNWCKRSQVWDMFFPSGFSAKVQ